MNNTITTPHSFVRLGANHGYRIDGDVARIHADVEIIDHPPLADDWALQLWACDAPHTGGPLSGVMIAEAAFTGSADATERLQRLDAEAQARVPGGRRDFAMVLVLAAGAAGQDRQIHDFANYPVRQRFLTPHFEGGGGYRVDGEHVVLTATAVRSPRGIDNLSGSLSLELWALPAPYRGASVDGQMMGRVELGRLGGQQVLTGLAQRVPFSAPSAGRWNVTMMLREWAGPAGYVTRDYANFPVPYVTVDERPAPHREPEPVSVDRADADHADANRLTVIAVHPALDPLKRQPDPSDTPSARGSSGVSINRASAEQLAAVKGVSKTVARAIVGGRPYDSLEALLDVRGIGPKLLAKLRPFLTM